MSATATPEKNDFFKNFTPLKGGYVFGNNHNKKSLNAYSGHDGHLFRWHGGDRIHRNTVNKYVQGFSAPTVGAVSEVAPSSNRVLDWTAAMVTMRPTPVITPRSKGPMLKRIYKRCFAGLREWVSNVKN